MGPTIVLEIVAMYITRLNREHSINGPYYHLGPKKFPSVFGEHLISMDIHPRKKKGLGSLGCAHAHHHVNRFQSFQKIGVCSPRRCMKGRYIARKGADQ